MDIRIVDLLDEVYERLKNSTNICIKYCIYFKAGDL